MIPNSSRDAKKHIRNQSNDDKLMEVEGFENGTIQQQNFMYSGQKDQ